MNKYKLSSYTIPIQVENDQKYLLVHGYTGAIDIISDSLFHEIKKHDLNITENSTTISPDVIERLVNRGHLTTKTVQEEQLLVKKIANALHNHQKKFRSFMFLITYDCNFRCSYCFQKEVIEENSRQWSQKAFTKTMVDKAYENMLKMESESSEIGNKEIILYGGEPLMAKNKEIVKYIVNKGKQLGYYFAAVTNGYDLDYFEDLLALDMISRLQITVDGVKEYHDNRRTHYLYGDSFDKIVENIGLALNKDITVTIRINTDLENINSIPTLNALFESKGFLKHNKFKFYSAPLDSQGKEKEVSSLALKQSVNPQTISYLNNSGFYKMLNKSEIGIETSYNHTYYGILNALKKNKPLPLFAVNCGAHANLYIFDPFGDIYTCWELVGEKDHIVGNYEKVLSWNLKHLNYWHKRNIGTVAQCSQCTYALLCGGGCLSKHLARKGSYDTSFCNQFPYVFKLNFQKAYQAYTKIGSM